MGVLHPVQGHNPWKIWVALSGSLGALVNPGAKQSDFIRGQILGRSKTARSTRTTTGAARAAATGTCGTRLAFASGRAPWTAWASGSTATRSTRTATLSLRRHGVFRIQTGDRDHEGAFLAFASDDNLAVFAALQDSFEAIESEIGLLAFLTVATDAGSFEQGFDILGEGQSFFRGRRWELGEVDIRSKREACGHNACTEQEGRFFHRYLRPEATGQNCGRGLRHAGLGTVTTGKQIYERDLASIDPAADARGGKQGSALAFHLTF